jgi:hypothetical protein
MGPCPACLEFCVKKLVALALVSAFALVAFAADEKKPEPKKSSCGMACCEKNKTASCKDCSDCGKKKDTPKKEEPKKG